MIESLTSGNVKVGLIIQVLGYEKNLVLFGKIFAVGSNGKNGMQIAVYTKEGTEKFFDLDVLIKYHAMIMDDIGLVEQANTLSVSAKQFAKIAVTQ